MDNVTIQTHIFRLRGKPVMLDKDLASLYQVKPIALRQQVKRNLERFPPDFMFTLSNYETDLLVSQNVIPTRKHLGGYLPYAFTQEGIAMLSGVLKSPRAVLVNIAIMRAFVKLRYAVLSSRDVARRVEKLEGKVDVHETDIRLILEDVRQLKKKSIPTDPINPEIV
ncbi:MAG: ORF6N domain-containing protein [Elusimicrobiota bacterium]|jgi:hypothetical protein